MTRWMKCQVIEEKRDFFFQFHRSFCRSKQNIKFLVKSKNICQIDFPDLKLVNLTIFFVNVEEFVKFKEFTQISTCHFSDNRLGRT